MEFAINLMSMESVLQSEIKQGFSRWDFHLSDPVVVSPPKISGTRGVCPLFGWQLSRVLIMSGKDLHVGLVVREKDDHVHGR